MPTSHGTQTFHLACSRARSISRSNDWRLPRENAKIEERERNGLLPKRKEDGPHRPIRKAAELGDRVFWEWVGRVGEAMVDVEPHMRTALIAVSGLLIVMASTGSACSGPSVTVAGEWIRVMETGPAEERFVTYAGPATLSRSGTTVRMSSVIDSTVVDDAASTRRRVSWKDTWEYDCQDGRQRPVQYTEYSGRMGTGDKMYSYSYTVGAHHWQFAKPGSVGEALWKIACGQQ